MLPFPAASFATSASISTLTVPPDVGVTVNVYVVPLPEKLEAVPFVTVIFPNTKLETDSLNVAVTENGALTGSEAAEVRATVGWVLSTVKVAVDSAEEIPAELTTNILYDPSVAGARIEVAVPPAVVIVAPAEKTVVPEGANQILLVAFPELTTVTLEPPVLEILVGNTTS